jgi:SLIDE
MQELELNYPTTKGKVYSEEEDRYLLCRLNHYGMQVEDVYERIKRDISEFPVFRFDWFFKSRSPQELARRCTTLLTMIEKEAEADESTAAAPKKAVGGNRGKVGFVFFVSLKLQCLSSISLIIETSHRRGSEGRKSYDQGFEVKHAFNKYRCGKLKEETKEELIVNRLLVAIRH